MSAQVIHVFFGLIASGKSTLAGMFADRQERPYYNTDRVRKELAGLGATERSPDGMDRGIYTPEFTERTYQAMLERTRQDILAGRSGVVLDGSYARRIDRKQVFDLAAEMEVDICFVLCFCSDQEVRRRLAIRARDPEAVSDGRWEIFVVQKQRFEDPDELAPGRLLRLNTEADPEHLLEQVVRFTTKSP
jgi:predicted kinase